MALGGLAAVYVTMALLTEGGTYSFMTVGRRSAEIMGSLEGKAAAAVNLAGSEPQRTFAPASAAIARTGVTLRLGKCINIGGYLETGEQGEQLPFPESRFNFLKQGGFSTVRIPVRWDVHAAHMPPYKIEPEWMATVKEYASRATRSGLNVIVDIHHFRDLDRDPAGNRERYISFWRQISEAFADAPDNVWFDLLNEPGGEITDSILQGLYNEALREIRRTNPTRNVLVTARGGHTETLANLMVPDDPHVIPAFHTYAPLAFTHQGASWTSDKYPLGTHFGSDADYRYLNRELNITSQFMTRTGRVPVIVEFGAIRYAGMDDRIRYYRAISSAFASLGVQSCVWSDTIFPIWDDNGWNHALKDAIETTR